MVNNMIKIKIFGIEGISAKDELYDAAGLDELIAELCRKYMISRKTLYDCIILVNGRSIAADNYMNVSFKDGDEIQLLAPIVGG